MIVIIYSTISLLLTGFYLCVLIFLASGWEKIKRPELKTAVFKTKITVMVAARNEEKKIALTIDDILAQDYPKHLTEIIFVDDHSTDSTADIIRSYASRGVKLLQLNIDKPLNSYKKKAIAEAIALSSGELMVATDADCRMGPKWLSSIVNYYESENPVMISSPVAYFEEKSLFELLQTLEFSFLVGFGAAFIGHNRASNCNGANLAYRKDVFYEVGGFKGIDELASGDDELLLQKVAVLFPERIGFLKLNDAVVYTHAKADIKEFLNQRRRWASKSTKYKDKKVVAVTVAIWLSNVTMLLNIVLGFFDPWFFKLFLLQIGLKCVCEMIVLFPIVKFLKRPDLVWLNILLSPLHILYMTYIGLIGSNRKYTWKDRKVR